MYKRDVSKISEHIGSIENAKFSVLAGLPEEGTGMGRKVQLEEKITLKNATQGYDFLSTSKDGGERQRDVNYDYRIRIFVWARTLLQGTEYGFYHRVRPFLGEVRPLIPARNTRDTVEGSTKSTVFKK